MQAQDLEQLNESGFLHGRLERLPGGGIRFCDSTAGRVPTILGAVAFIVIVIWRNEPYFPFYAIMDWKVEASIAAAVLLFGIASRRQIDATTEGLSIRHLLLGCCYWRKVIPRDRIELSVQFAGHSEADGAYYRLRYAPGLFRYLPGSSSELQMRRLAKLLQAALAGERYVSRAELNWPFPPPDDRTE